MTQLNMEQIFVENAVFSKSYILNNIHEKQLSLFKELWRNELDRVNRPNGSQSKFRTHKILKQTFGTETYVSSDIPKPNRSALFKFRYGVVPIKLETRRYEKLPVADHKCFVCDTVESECHVICECPVYEDLRNSLFNKAKNVVQNFETLSMSEKMCTVLSNCDFVKLTAKILCDMLKRRRSFFIQLRICVLSTICSF